MSGKKEKNKRYSHLSLVLLLGWTFLNIIQGYFTELFHDEAYYWMYGQHIDWGYWEHAPMIGLMTWLGSSIFSGEIGVRFFSILMSTGTIWLLLKMVNPKNLWLFWAMIGSMVLVHVGGFFSAPDSPLIFFTALFLFQYRRFIANPSIKETLLLAVIAALLMYSKYHGGLVIFFTAISNLRLFKMKQFWGVVILSTLLYLPHFWWLVDNQFETFQYHLLKRPQGHFPFETPLNYLLGQVLFSGPFVGVIVLLGMFKVKAKDEFERALKFVSLGILGFLGIFSFRGWIEANWAAAAYIPAIILSYQWLREKPEVYKWIYRLAVPSILLMIVLRVYLIYDFYPPLRKIRPEFHGWPEWAERIEEKAGEKPVLFFNDYKLPSKYTFYTGKPAYTLSNAWYHKTSFDLWGSEDSLQGKDVMIVSRTWVEKADDLFDEYGKKYFVRKVDDFVSFSQVKIQIPDVPKTLKIGERDTLSAILVNEYDHHVNLAVNPEIPIQIMVVFFKEKKTHTVLIASEVLTHKIEAGASDSVNVRFRPPHEPGTYQMLFMLKHGWYYPCVNGERIEIEVK